jgi:MOSC domain-containing protein YiiM
MRVEGIAVRKERGGEMVELSSTLVTSEGGLEGDFGRKPGKFMVTILSAEQWAKACKDVSIDLAWTVRRANILISGYEFSNSDVGKTLTLGDLQLKVTRETDPCNLMDQACDGLKRALTPNWRGGVRAQVINSGNIAIGDDIQMSPLR